MSTIDLATPCGLDGRVAVVTGASSGLGNRFARVLHAAGATVVASARRGDRLEALREDLGDRLVPIVADVAVDADCERLVAYAIALDRHPDVLVNNSCIGPATAPQLAPNGDLPNVLDLTHNTPFLPLPLSGPPPIHRHTPA